MTTSALPWRIEGCEIIDANDGRVAKLIAPMRDVWLPLVTVCDLSQLRNLKTLVLIFVAFVTRSG